MSSTWLEHPRSRRYSRATHADGMSAMYGSLATSRVIGRPLVANLMGSRASRIRRLSGSRPARTGQSGRARKPLSSAARARAVQRFLEPRTAAIGLEVRGLMSEIPRALKSVSQIPTTDCACSLRSGTTSRKLRAWTPASVRLKPRPEAEKDLLASMLPETHMPR